MLQTHAVRPSRTRIPSIASVALAATLAVSLAPQATAAPQSDTGSDAAWVELLLRDGRWIDGRLESLGSAACTVVRAEDGVHGKGTDIAHSEIVACLAGRDRWRSMEFMTQIGGGTLVFSDGQLLPGTLRSDSKPPRWEHRWLGAIPIKTDLLSEIRIVATRRAPAATDADTILFVNGDIATGFIESIGDEVVLEPTQKSADTADAGESGKAAAPSPTRRVQLDRIAAITFAALGQPPSSDPLLWTADGSIVRAKEIAFEPDAGWRFAVADAEISPGGAPKPITGAVTRPVAILFDRSSLTPLAACGQPEHRSAESSYRYEARPQVRIESPDQSLLGLGAVEFDGPVYSRFTLPATLLATAGTVAFSAELALLEPVPSDARATVTVRFSGSKGETVTLDATNRRATVRVMHPLAKDSTLEILVDDGGNGIAGDRIAVRRGCFVRQP